MDTTRIGGFLLGVLLPAAGVTTEPHWPKWIDRGDRAMKSGKYEEAIEHYRHARKLMRQDEEPQAVGEVHMKLGRAHAKLAETPRKERKDTRGHWGRAASEFRDAWRVYASLYGKEDIQLFEAIDAVACALEEEMLLSDSLSSMLRCLRDEPGSYKEVTYYFLLALDIQEKAMGETEPDTMLYRAKLSRKLYSWTANLRKLSGKEKNEDTRDAAADKAEELRQLADDLRLKDRELRESAATQPATTQPGRCTSAPTTGQADLDIE